MEKKLKETKTKTIEDRCFEEIFDSTSEILMTHIDQATKNNGDKCIEKIDFSNISTNRLNPTFVAVSNSLSNHSRNHILSTIMTTDEIVNDPMIINTWFYYKFDMPMGMSKITLIDENGDQKLDNLDKLYLYVVIPKDRPNPNQMASVLNTTYHEVDHSVRFYNRYKNYQNAWMVPEDEEVEVDFYGNLVEYLFRQKGMEGEETKNKLISRDGLIKFDLAYKLDRNNIFPENYNLYNYLFNNSYRYQILYILLDYIREIHDGDDDKYILEEEDLRDYVQKVAEIEEKWSSFWQNNFNNQLYKTMITDLFKTNIINPYFFTDNPYHRSINNDSAYCYPYQNANRCLQACRKTPPLRLKNISQESLYCLSYPALNCCSLLDILPF